MAELPAGETPPSDGSLPMLAARAWAASARRLSVYLHVPFCAKRCGYCDFTTYTLRELDDPYGTSVMSTFLSAVGEEVSLARRVLGHSVVETIFVGGGTPTLLPMAQLTELIGVSKELGEWAPHVEVSVEANPDTVTPEVAEGLAAAGVTRVSMGMQSSVSHVLATLDRTHRPEQLPAAVRLLKAAGLRVSVDLMYGTPGESLEDWRRSVHDAVALEPGHVSAYALTVEPATALGQLVKRGVVPTPDPDDQADKYLLADEVLSAAGFTWYEISNWAASPEDQCRHNLAYWRNQDWWGFGPGAHSHVQGVRWWNTKRPATYAAQLGAGFTPAVGREVLTQEQRRLEEVMLGMRIRAGLPLASLSQSQLAAVPQVVKHGWASVERDHVVLSLQGRLLADTVLHTLGA